MHRRKTPSTFVGGVAIGSDHPVVVQSMTNTDTADVKGTARQVAELSRAGSELVRITVNTEEAAAAEAEGGASRALKERHDRALKRASTALYISGLEILAGFYRDAASAQYGGGVRNSDVPPKAFTSFPMWHWRHVGSPKPPV